MPPSEPSADESPASPVAPVSGNGAPSSPPEGTFELDPDGPRVSGSRVKYAKPLKEYAETYGFDERTVKRWVERGKAAEPMDLPPLHRPALMPDWFSRRMERAVPEAILLAASEARLSVAVAKPEPVPVLKPAEPEPVSNAPPVEARSKVDPAPPDSKELPPKPRDFSNVKAMTFEENVEALRRQLAIQFELLQEAMAGADNGLMSSRQKAYRECMAELRKAEQDLLTWQEERGDLARLTEVRSENNRIASTVFNAVLRLVKNVRPQLAGKTEAEQDKIWDRETLACFSILKSAKFTTYEPT